MFFALVSLLAGPFLQLISHQYGPPEGLPEAPLNRVLFYQGEIYAEAGRCYIMTAEHWVEAGACPAALQNPPERIPELTFPARYYLRQPIPNTDAKAQALAIDSDGHRWIGTDKGIVVTMGDDYLFTIAPGPGGLPYNDVTALALDESTGAVWVDDSLSAHLPGIDIHHPMECT